MKRVLIHLRDKNRAPIATGWMEDSDAEAIKTQVEQAVAEAAKKNVWVQAGSDISVYSADVLYIELQERPSGERRVRVWGEADE